MAVVEFVGQSAQDADNIAANPSRIVNFYREPIVAGGKTRYALKSVLGQEQFATVDRLFVRAMGVVDGVAYIAAGGYLTRISALGVATDLGAIADSAETTISGNTGNVVVCAGGLYYVWDGLALSQPTGSSFTDFGSLETIGGYTVLTERNGRRIQWTDLVDPATFDALNFATTEARDDDNLRAVAINGNLWIFKTASVEIYYITGQGTSSAFARVSGAVLDTGLKSFGLVTKFDGGAFFIGDDGIAYITSGAGLQPVSTPSVETSISQGEPSGCFYYEDEGHKFCVIRFEDRAAWCYDLSTGEWHERASGSALEAWSVRAMVKAYGKWLTIATGGQIGAMGRFNADFGGTLRRMAVSRTLYLGGDRFRVSFMEILMRMGRSYLGRPSAARAAMLWVRVSKDGGQTWGAEKWRTISDQGQYTNTVRYRALGQFRQMTVELNITDPTEIPVYCDANVVVQ